jgi:hypothetical protein
VASADIRVIAKLELSLPIGGGTASRWLFTFSNVIACAAASLRLTVWPP